MNNPPRRRFYQRLRFRVLIFCLTPVMFVAGVWSWTGWSLSSRLAELRAAGMPTTAAELNDFYRVPEGSADTTDTWMAALDATMTLDSLEIIQQGSLPILGSGHTPIPPRGQPWNQLEVARQFLHEIEPQMQVIRLAAAAGGVARIPIDCSDGFDLVIDHVLKVRQVGRLLELDARVKVHDEDFDRVFLDVKGLFATSEMLSAEPLMISQLVRMGTYNAACELTVDLLPQCRWTDSQLEHLQLTAAAADFRESVRRVFIGERAVSQTGFAMLPLGPLARTNRLRALELFAELLRALDGSWPEFLKETERIDAEVSELSRGFISRLVHTGIAMIFPSIQNTVFAGARATVHQRCLMVALGAQRYRLRHGHFPADMDKLQSLMPAGERVWSDDPFGSGSLRLQINNGDLLIYSVGTNAVDDGGAIDAVVDSQMPPDFGVRLQP